MSELKPQPWCVVEDGFGMGKLRILVPDAEARLTAALGFAAPSAGRLTRDDHLTCLRIGPHEWLVLGGMPVVKAALDRIEQAFRGDLTLILDVSHGGYLLRLSGAHAIERIAAYCDLDLRPNAFPTGHATRTRFGDVAVTVARLDDRPSFWLVADQTHADYLMLLIYRVAPAD